ncbi:Uncharacterized protein BP5553_04973 [Venustampulla echinocandica]|uniref:AAA+ ATPase domain-containing protein n=1 Tax=Venustampulla echinocandica TaxID=2656787 RepID=A0A370TPT7_9HELO|nr:Uncharacterized protein BP5553_04973 [Venustampulla echinocandica]RDL37540.1 Uncharacterized protein BP5553_04973 [Venustampulla echinocandica]
MDTTKGRYEYRSRGDNFSTRSRPRDSTHSHHPPPASSAASPSTHRDSTKTNRRFGEREQSIRPSPPADGIIESSTRLHLSHRQESTYESDEAPVSPQLRPEKHRGRPPLLTYNWRAEVCRFLNLGIESSDEALYEELQAAEKRLEEADRLTSLGAPPEDLIPRYQTIHRVRCAEGGQHEEFFLEEPFAVNSGPQNFHLRASNRIDNYDLYLERNKDVALVAFKDYRCCGSSRSRSRRLDPIGISDPSTLITNESVSIISAELCSALRDLTDRALGHIPHPEFEVEFEFPSPFLWWFHGRRELEESQQNLDSYGQSQIAVFQQYLDYRFEEEWATVDSLLAKGEISAQYIHYLYVPQTILVRKSEDERPGQQEAYIADSWLSRPDGGRSSGYLIDCKSWSFDGNFQKDSTTVSIGRFPSMKKTFKVTDLALYPISFAENGAEEALRERGKMFWKCRKRNYVCYSEGRDNGIQSMSDPRFMVDIATYKLMHPSDQVAGDFPNDIPKRANKDDLGAKAMSRDEPPARDDFLLCLPKSIPGFNMNKKEWTSLDVSRITAVTWNQEAFNTLVVDEATKKLISALVTTKIDAEKGTDLMSGKGNGLFILLHGGPGTGKTLTAESVAEYSKKPLYRVTCGDIGTKAEEVEKYLEVVMLLGKTWDCVVLLDEADVFLEQRRIFDLQRNALVSVFLRVLEYYDGILILTSNRVGIFDEAFKSRIQLTLRYKTLQEPQRLQIWGNFIARLESLQSSTFTPNHSPSPNATEDLGINVVEIRENLKELAEAELNGREIRNAISTARQLAMFEKSMMGYRHLKLVIEETRKFGEYLVELRKGFTPDEIMKDMGER